MTKSWNNSFHIFFQLTKRHFLVFFKNKIRVFYTLMVPLIILAVYICFLRELELSTVENMLYQLNIPYTAELKKYLDILVDSWMLSGIITLSTITISIQANNIIINDKENGVNRDFASSPINKNLLIGSYFLFNFIVTLLICFVVLLVCLIYLLVMGEFVISFADFIMMIAILSLSSITSTLLTIFICSFIKRESTLASLIAIFSAIAGFLIGAYMPLSMFPGWLRNVCCFIPGTYSCGLMRFAFLNTPIELFTQFMQTQGGIENASELIASLTNSFGWNINCFGVDIAIGYQALINIGWVVVFVVANVLSGKYLAKVTVDQ